MEHCMAMVLVWRGYADGVLPAFARPYLEMAEYYHAKARQHHANMVGFASRGGDDADDR